MSIKNRLAKVEEHIRDLEVTPPQMSLFDRMDLVERIYYAIESGTSLEEFDPVDVEACKNPQFSPGVEAFLNGLRAEIVSDQP